MCEIHNGVVCIHASDVRKGIIKAVDESFEGLTRYELYKLVPSRNSDQFYRAYNFVVWPESYSAIEHHLLVVVDGTVVRYGSAQYDRAKARERKKEEIGSHFGLDYSEVRKAVRRYKEELQKEKDLEELEALREEVLSLRENATGKAA
jgi:hypothetical protein